ncbi:hypothetical protein [Umezawaea sp.]
MSTRPLVIGSPPRADRTSATPFRSSEVEHGSTRPCDVPLDHRVPSPH